MLRAHAQSSLPLVEQLAIKIVTIRAKHVRINFVGSRRALEIGFRDHPLSGFFRHDPLNGMSNHTFEDRSENAADRTNHHRAL